MKRILLSISILCALVLAIPAQDTSLPASAVGTLSLSSDTVTLPTFFREDHRDTGAWITAPADSFMPYDHSELPRSYDDAMYTFRCYFTLSGAVRTIPLAVVLGPGSFPHDIYLNGMKIAQRGRHIDGYNSNLYATQSIYLPEALLKPGSEINELTIQAFPKYETQPVEKILLTTFSRGSTIVEIRNIFAVYVHKIAVILAFIVGIYFLFNFLLRVDRDRRYLFFASLCFVFSLSYINMATYYDAIDEVFIDRLSRAGLSLIMIPLTWLITEFTGYLKKNNIFRLGITGIGIALAVICLLQTSKYAIHVTVFPLVMNFFITPLLVFNLVLMIIAMIRRRTFNIVVLFFVYLFVVATALYDVYFIMNYITPYFWLIPYGYVALILAFFFLFAREQAIIYANSLIREDELNNRNRIMSELLATVRKTVSLLQEESNRLTTATQTISAAASEQAATTREVISSMEDSGNLSERVRIESEEVSQSAKDTSSSVREGVKLVKNLRSTMDTIQYSGEETVGEIRGLKAHIEGIAETIKLISGIADQSRIIAFNAELEASAAGEAGKNFTIVAGEVRRLADTTITATREIKSRITQIQNAAATLTKAAGREAANIGKGTAITDQTSGVFKRIENAAGLAEENSTQITELISQQNTAFQQIYSAIRQLSAGIEGFVDSANTSQQTAGELAGIARELNALVSASE